MTDLLNSALALAGAGVPVFPVHGTIRLPDGRLVCSCGTQLCRHPAKHPIAPLAPNGLRNATTGEAAIRQWWSCNPAANIGLATGKVIVLDIDPRHGGEDSLARLERENGPLPPTWRALTGGGGEHIYFAPSPFFPEIRNSAGQLGPGLDIRGVGGYVIAPPSVHVTGRRYAWSVDHHPDDVPLARMPNWLSQKLARPGAGARPPEEWRRLVAEGVNEGGRNQAVARLVGHLLRRDVDARVAHDLVQAWNATRCRPPLEADEVTRTVDSIAKKEAERREVANGRCS